MLHKLIIYGNKGKYMYSSTTLQIPATLHKLLPVHPTGYMLGVHIFYAGEVCVVIRN